MNNINIYKLYGKNLNDDDVKKNYTIDNVKISPTQTDFKILDDNDYKVINKILMSIIKLYQLPNIILNNFVIQVEKQSEKYLVKTLKKNIDNKLLTNKYKNNELLTRKSGLLDTLYRYILLICYLIKKKEKIEYIDEKLKIIFEIINDKSLKDDFINLESLLLFVSN